MTKRVDAMLDTNLQGGSITRETAIYVLRRVAETGKSVYEIVSEENLWQSSTRSDYIDLLKYIYNEVMADYYYVDQYNNNKNSINRLIGRVRKVYGVKVSMTVISEYCYFVLDNLERVSNFIHYENAGIV